MADHALFGDEAVKRGLHIHRPIVPWLQQPTTLPTTPSNTGRQHHLINQFPTKATTAITSTTSTSATTPTESTTTKTTATSNKLLDTQGWNLTGRSSVQVCTQLEEDHQPKLAFINCPERLPVTVYNDTIPLESKEDPPLPCRSISSGCGSRQISEGRHHLSISNNSEQGLPLQLLYCPGTNEASSDFRLHQPQQIFADSSLQDGGYSGLEGGDYRTRRLYVQN